MDVTLPPELAAIVARLRATGQFEDDLAVLRAALVDLDRKARAWAEKHATLRAAIAEGLEGPFETWSAEDAIARLNAEADGAFAKAAE